jgi:hypothetical protein
MAEIMLLYKELIHPELAAQINDKAYLTCKLQKK